MRRRPRAMAGAEFAAARARLGWSVDEAAAAYRLTPAVVERWERGVLRIPHAVADDIEYRAAVVAREAADAACPLPECPERERLERGLASAEGAARPGPEAMEALDALQRHLETCERCIARGRWIDEHAGPLPERPLPELGGRVPLFRVLLAGVALVGGIRAIAALVGDPGPSTARTVLLAVAVAIFTLALVAALVARRPTGASKA